MTVVGSAEHEILEPLGRTLPFFSDLAVGEVLHPVTRIAKGVIVYVSGPVLFPKEKNKQMRMVVPCWTLQVWLLPNIVPSLSDNIFARNDWIKSTELRILRGKKPHPRPANEKSFTSRIIYFEFSS